MAKGLLNPRDPDNEIHLVLTPFEASTLLRVLVHSSLDSSSSATKPIRQALYAIGVKCATLDEIKKGTLQ